MTVCRRCASPLESDDLRCAICGLGTEPDGAPAPVHALAHVLRCRGCGAAIGYDPSVQAPRCAFCRAVMEVERPTDPIEAATWVVPFRVSPEHAHDALRAYLASLGFFRPKDLATQARLHGTTPLHWASWIVDASAYVTWAADSNAGSGRAAWAPHGGATTMGFSRVVVSASRGLREREAAALATRYDLASAVPATTIGDAHRGAIERYDVQRSAARRLLAGSLERMARDRLEAGIIPGSRFRNVHVSVLLRALTTHRVALPAYVLAYRYRDRVYRAVVHGQDPRCTFGEAPIAWGRVALVVAGVGLGLLALVLVIALLAR